MVRHIHSSGRYDRPDEAVRNALRRYASHADLITLTETQKRERNVLRMDGWRVSKYSGAGTGDPAILTDSRIWEVLLMWSHKLTDKEQRRGPGGPPPPHSLTVLLRNKGNGKRLLVSVAHLPSHVEGDWRDRTWRVQVWLEAHREWKRHVNWLRKRYRVKVMMVADWNLDIKKRWVRAALKALHPRLKLTWREPFEGGTHHNRIIDATVTSLRVLREAVLFEDDASSDHRPYFEVLGF